MGRVEPLRDLGGDGEGIGDRQTARPREARLEGLALVQRHREEELPVLRLARLVDAANTRMIECARRARLPQKPLAHLRVEALPGERKLECDRASEMRVDRA